MRSSSVLAGASGTYTGRKVRLLTSSATCGFQKSALTNQSPSMVVDSSSELAAGAPFIRSRSFLVPRTISIARVCHAWFPPMPIRAECGGYRRTAETSADAISISKFT